MCGVLLSCHTRLAAIKLNVPDHDGSAETEAVELSVNDESKATGERASSHHASLISLQDIPTSAMGLKTKHYPTWWNDTQHLPDAQPIFIHIPKTGGVSIEDLASKAGHVTGACVVHSFGDDALPYPLAKGYLMEPYHTPPARFVPYSFTVVRNPYARMVSEFNWVALNDPEKAADIKAGKWSFSCEDFQKFVQTRVLGLTGAPLFRCLMEEGFAQEGYEACDAKNLGTIDDSHAIPQWLFAKNAERVFRYEHFVKDVWPFLRGTGVVASKRATEKVNSAGAVSETASKCWPFLSNKVLSDFIALYAMDFKNLGYRTTAFGDDAAAAAAAAGVALGDTRPRLEDGVGGGESGAVTATIASEGGGAVPIASAFALNNDPSKPLSEEAKAEARSVLLNVDVSGVYLDHHGGAVANDAGAPGAVGAETTAGAAGAGSAAVGEESSTAVAAAGARAESSTATAAMGGETEEQGGRTTPGCVKRDAMQSLGAEEEAGWTPPSWAVVEGVLRRAVFKCQSLAESMKSSVANAGDALAGVGGSGAAVAAALTRVVEARDLAETAARNPLGRGGHEAFAAAAKAAKEAARAVEAASAALEREGETFPRTVRDEFLAHAAAAADASGALLEAVETRRARQTELFNDVRDDRKAEQTAALSGYLR